MKKHLGLLAAVCIVTGMIGNSGPVRHLRKTTPSGETFRSASAKMRGKTVDDLYWSGQVGKDTSGYNKPRPMSSAYSYTKK